MEKSEPWELVFVLPNLNLTENDTDTSALRLGLEGIAIVPERDPRVEGIVVRSEGAQQLLESFRGAYGEPLDVAVLIVRRDWLRRLGPEATPIVAFRNSVAMASVVLTRARGESGSFIGTSWADSFDFSPAEVALGGERVNIVTPMITHLAVPTVGLCLTVDPGVPRSGAWPLDDMLAVWLGKVWRRRFLQGRDVRKSAALFRSLEIAYLAASVRFKNYGSIHEAGLGAVLWVNAIEALASPPDRFVNRMDGVALVGAYEWRDPALDQRRYRVVEKRKNGRVIRSRYVNFAQRLYDHLHIARSKFVHGDRISRRLLRPYRDRPPLLALASTVYRAALSAYLSRHWPWEPSLEERLELGIFSAGQYHRQLLGSK